MYRRHGNVCNRLRHDVPANHILIVAVLVVTPTGTVATTLKASSMAQAQTHRDLSRCTSHIDPTNARPPYS